MADEQIIVDIRVKSEDVSEAKNKISQLTESIESLSNTIKSAKKQNDDYKNSQAELTKQYEQNKISSEKYIQEVDKLNTKINANNQLIAENKIQLSKENAERSANIKLISSEVGAYTQLSNQYSIAAKKAKDLGVQYGVNSEQFKEAAMAANTLQNELKEIDNAVGQNQRNVGNYEGSIKGLKMELRELKGVLQNAAEGSAEYNAALKRAAEITDNLDDAQKRIAGTAMDFDGVTQNVTKTLSGLASGYEAVQGISILVGDENENLQKSLLKVQAAMSVAQGLEGMGGLSKTMANLWTQIKQSSLGIRVITAAQWLWNAAMSANPIGLVVAGIAALGAAIYGLTKYFESEEAAIKKQNTALDGTILLSQEARDEYNNNIIALEELGQQYDVLTGKMTGFQKQIKDLTEEYVIDVQKLQDETAEKLDNVGWFWRSFVVGISQAKKEAASKEQDIEIESLKKWSQLRDIRIAKEKLIRENQKKEQEKKKQEDIKSVNDAAKKESENSKKEGERLNNEKIAREEKSKEELQKIADEKYKRDQEILEFQGQQYAIQKENEINAEIESENQINEELDIVRGENEKKQSAKIDKFSNQSLEKEKKREEDSEYLKSEIRENLFNESESFLQDLAAARQEKKLETIKANAAAEEEILKNQLDKGLITEDEYNKKLLELNKKTNIEEAKVNKKKAIWEIAIATAVGVAKQLFNPIKMAAAAIAGAIQMAFVVARPIPTFGGGTSNIVSIGNSHASGNDVDVWGFAGGKKQFFGKVEKGEAMPVIRKSAINDYLIAKMNGKLGSQNRTFANGTNDIVNQAPQIDTKTLIDNMINAFSNVKIVTKIEDITKEAGRKVEIVSNSKV